MTVPVMVNGRASVATDQHKKRHRAGHVRLAKHLKPSRICPNNVWHRNHAEEQRRDSYGSSRGSQISQTRGRDHEHEEGSMYSRSGALLPSWNVVARCRAAAAPMERQLSQHQQEHRDADRLVQLIENKLKEQLLERQADHIDAHRCGNQDECRDGPVQSTLPSAPGLRWVSRHSRSNQRSGEYGSGGSQCRRPSCGPPPCRTLSV